MSEEKENNEPLDYIVAYVWACTQDASDPCGCSQARVEISRGPQAPLRPRREDTPLWTGKYFSDHESGARTEFVAFVKAGLPGLQRALELPAKILDNSRVTWVPVPGPGDDDE